MANNVKVSKTAKNSTRSASVFQKIRLFFFGNPKRNVREDHYARYTRAHFGRLEQQIADLQAENSKLHAWVIYSGQTLNYDKFSRAVGVIKVKA